MYLINIKQLKRITFKRLVVFYETFYYIIYFVYLYFVYTLKIYKKNIFNYFNYMVVAIKAIRYNL